MPTVDQERNLKIAVDLYGLWVGKPMHDTPTPVPSFIAHTLLVKVFRVPDETAGEMVNELIKEARQKPDWEATREILTHGGKRAWVVSAATATPATLFMIEEPI
jgi:hypothetical protein